MLESILGSNCMFGHGFNIELFVDDLWSLGEFHEVSLRRKACKLGGILQVCKYLID